MSGERAWIGYGWALTAVAASTFAALAMRPRFDLANIAMIYLLPVVFIALRFSRGPAIATSILCVAAFDFLFVPPVGTFTVHDIQHLLTFAIMLAVGLVISRLVERVRRQAKEQAALELRAESERIRSALLASISHDLRTPLAIMSGAASTLAEKGESLNVEERGALANSVFRQARDMSAHMANVLQMTRFETGDIRVERDWGSIGEIAGAVLDRLKERLSEHRLIVELPDDLPLVRVNATLIEQGLGNLLENAAKYTPPGTLVRLRAERRDSEVVVSVEDFGAGLADGEFERVFQKFHRGAIEGTRGGMGLGLAICRAIVRLHGGRVWGECVPGGGAAFRFALPLEPAPALPAESLAAA